MITAEEAKKYVKEFVPSSTQTAILADIESQIKKGERHPCSFTTRLFRQDAEDLAKYCREKLGFTNARIVDIYNNRTGARGGNYLQIDL